MTECKFREEWNVIPLPKNEKIPKLIWKEYQIKKYPKEKLKQHEGNFAVICGKISDNLLVIDPDFKKKEYFKYIWTEFMKKYPELNTYIEETPKGFHLFYKTMGFAIDRKINKNLISKKIKGKEIFSGIIKTNFSKYLTGIDLLGNNGFCLIPPSKVNDKEYKPYNNEPIKEITKSEYDKIIEFFLLKTPKEMRKPFVDVLNGKIDIEEQASKTGKEEFLYWEGLFREAWNYCELEPNEIYSFLESNQPAFSVKTTETQLKYHPHTDKPFTNDKLKEMFPEHSFYTPKKKKILEKAEEEEDLFKTESKLSLKEETDKITKELLEEFDIITLKDSRQILLRTNISYSLDNELLIERLKEKARLVSKGSYQTIKTNALEVVKDSTLFDRENLCYDPYLIPFKNGVLNILTDKFYLKEDENIQSYRFFYEIPQNYQEGEFKCLKFKKMLRMLLGNPFSKIRIRDMFEAIGLCLTMNVQFKKAFFNYGKKDSGKTQFTNVLSVILDQKNISTTSLQQLEKRFGTNALQFKILNLHPDLPSNRLGEMGIFKACTGGDLLIPAEIKGGNQYHFKNVAKFWFNANEIPKIGNQEDEAFFGRWILFPFPNKFSIDNGNLILDFYKDVIENEDEVQGIIHESIKGLKRLIKRKEFRQKIVENTKHIWNYNSNPLYAFLYDNTIRIKEGKIPTSEFWENYNQYLVEKGYEGIEKNKLTRELQKYRIPNLQKRVPDNPKERDQYYCGIDWKKGIIIEHEDIDIGKEEESKSYDRLFEKNKILDEF